MAVQRILEITAITNPLAGSRLAGFQQGTIGLPMFDFLDFCLHVPGVSGNKDYICSRML